MFHRSAALGLVLALCAMSPKNAAGQTQSEPRRPSVGTLGLGSANPFNPDIHITLRLGDFPACGGDNSQHQVSARILNILGQAVVVPKLFNKGGDFTPLSSSQTGVPITNITLGCGKYDAYWNGHLRNDLGSPEAPSGTYLVQVVVDGKPLEAQRIFYRK